MQHTVILQQAREVGLADDDLKRLKQFLTAPQPFASRGITAGHALSPLLGALYLTPLDLLMQRWRREKRIIGYHRYMDDIVILCKTRWHCRTAIKHLFKVLDKLGLTVHRDKKRFIGLTSRGFDFLGYQVQSGRQLRPSTEAIRRFYARITSLMSKEPHRLRLYIAHWQRYYYAGLKRIVSRQGGVNRNIKRCLHYLKKSGWKPPP